MLKVKINAITNTHNKNKRKLDGTRLSEFEEIINIMSL